MAVKFDRVGFRKIETYLDMRKKLLYTAHAVGSRGSERCEREVFHQKVVHTTRVDPLFTTTIVARSSEPSTVRARVYAIETSRHLAGLMTVSVATAQKRPNIFCDRFVMYATMRKWHGACTLASHRGA